MGPKTILACLSTSDNAELVLRAAVPIARRHNAHLTGLHVLEALQVYPGIAIHVPDIALPAFEESQEEQAGRIRAIFDAQVGHETFEGEFRLLRAEGLSGNAKLVESARAADLVIVAQDSVRFDPGHVIRYSGRPVLVIPPEYEGGEIGASILLGWSDTREAARAAHDMLSVAVEGAKVTVLRVGPVRRDMLHDSRGVDIAEHLARHGLEVRLDGRDPLGEATAEVLIQTGQEIGADLIVTGAFGHSFAYDLVIGAATRDLLDSATCPVLFSK